MIIEIMTYPSAGFSSAISFYRGAGREFRPLRSWLVTVTLLKSSIDDKNWLLNIEGGFVTKRELVE
ncbi:hypothetical protein BB347_16045 [Natronorubrum daqingense]|uniref:Uncharacterized protein n=1 Tax=Natronorubrum daqingense TaxID=588898 RepID=A0A1P8RH68_9EURY|nr:hypothetical protein BB347_16045 [Natronorubrum daqingense]